MSDANADQRTYWTDQAGPAWAAMQARMDAQLGPLGEAATAALAPQAGERILDVGCGCGDTTLQLAAAVGPGGQVTGVDISETLITVARSRAIEARTANVDFRVADAQTEAFVPAGFNGVFSRFGVMFFNDPAAAFTNLRRAMKPGGRIAFVCWRPPSENAMFMAPMIAAAKHLPPLEPPQPGAPGPFAFAEAGRATSLLTEAGFTDAHAEPLDLEISPGPLDDALMLALNIGPLAGLLREHPDRCHAVTDDVRDALAALERDGKVRFASATWIVTATAP